MRIASLLLGCLVVASANAQTPYAKVIQHPGNPLYARVYNGDVSPSGWIVTVGSAELGSTITVYNDSAEFQWGKRIAPASVTDNFIPLQVQWMPNNDILLTGYVHVLPNGRNIGMMRLDGSGNVLWTEMFLVSSAGWTTDSDARVLALSTGDIMVLSTLNSWLALSKFDPSGQHLWSMTFPDHYVNASFRYDLQEFSNGDILIRDASSAVRLDQGGNVLFGYGYDFPGEVVQTPQVYLPRTCVLNDGGFILQSIVDYYPALIRFDSAATIVWAKKYDYGDFYQPWFQAIKELPSGDILAFPTSTWNRTIGVRIGPAGDPVASCGVEGDFRLWPGSSAQWPQAFAGVSDSLYHFVGSVEQLVNGGFTPPQTLLLRLDQNLVLPCASAISPFTSVDIVGTPPPLDISATQTATCSQWTFAHNLQDIPYATVEACSMVITIPESIKVPSISVYPSMVGTGGTVHVVSTNGHNMASWNLFDMSGRQVAAGMLPSTHEGSISLPSSVAPGLHTLLVLDREGIPLTNTRIVLQ